MPAFSTKDCISGQAFDQITPLPLTMSGCFALDERVDQLVDLRGARPIGRGLSSGRPERRQSTFASSTFS